MKNRHPGSSIVSICTVILAGYFTVLSSPVAAVAGKVVFAVGQPQAVDTQGASRTLARGSEVFSGDTLVTGSGRLQISLIDGAFVSVQPDSEYRIENYNYPGQADGTELATYRLEKGGVRAITGIIGRQNPEAYKVHTAIATIGIRGTGHNTRICQGDCGTIKDGLYHNTWEGITYVVNDVDIQDVPAGKGVYVQDIDSLIEFLDQPPAVTAVETTKEKRETEQRESEEQTRVVSTGEQREEGGDQRIVIAARDEETLPEPTPEPEPEPEPTPEPQPPAVTSTVLTGIGLLGVIPDETEPDGVDVFGFQFGSSVFRRDSDNQAIAIFGLDDDDFEQELTLGTIDPEAVRGSVDPGGTSVVSDAIALLDQADPAQVSFFEANPASTAEFFFNGEIGFGRWTGGRILVVHEDSLNPGTFSTEVDELRGNQSVHFIFGPDPGPIATSGSASYDFIGGTRSTSASGATIGEGVLEGSISIFFGTGEGTIGMDVDHAGDIYSVSGFLNVNPAANEIFDFNVTATSSAAGCSPSCVTFIDGGFVGPGTAGIPSHIGIEYDIQNSIDIIMGVAGFGLAP